jgi:hypothetical protein
MLRGSIVFYWIDPAPAAAVAQRARAAGVRALAVKCGDAGAWWPQYDALAGVLDDAGIARPAWAYCRPASLEADVEVAARAVRAGAPAFIADMEAEYVDEPAAASRFGALLRGRLGYDSPLYVTTFAGPQSQPAFPWREVTAWADGLVPQWYACAYPGGDMAAQAEAGYRALAPFATPVLPAGALYGAARAADVDILVALARRHRSPAVLWWRYGASSEALLRHAASADPTPDPGGDGRSGTEDPTAGLRREGARRRRPGGAHGPGRP